MGTAKSRDRRPSTDRSFNYEEYQRQYGGPKWGQRDYNEVEVYAPPADERASNANIVELRPDEYEHRTEYAGNPQHDLDRKHQVVVDRPYGRQHFEQGRSREEFVGREKGRREEHRVNVGRGPGPTRKPVDYERHVTEEHVPQPHGGKAKQVKVYERQSTLLGSGYPAAMSEHHKIKEVRQQFERTKSEAARERAALLHRLQELEEEENRTRSALTERDRSFQNKRQPILSKIRELEIEQQRERERLQQEDSEFIRSRREIEGHLRDLQTAEERERQALQNKETELQTLETKLKERERVIFELYRNQQAEYERKMKEMESERSRLAQLQAQATALSQEEERRRANAAQLASETAKRERETQQEIERLRNLQQERLRLEQEEKAMRDRAAGIASASAGMRSAAEREAERAREMQRQREQLERERMNYEKELEARRMELEKAAQQFQPEQVQATVEKETVVRQSVQPVAQKTSTTVVSTPTSSTRERTRTASDVEGRTGTGTAQTTVEERKEETSTKTKVEQAPNYRQLGRSGVVDDMRTPSRVWA